MRGGRQKAAKLNLEIIEYSKRKIAFLPFKFLGQTCLFGKVRGPPVCPMVLARHRGPGGLGGPELSRCLASGGPRASWVLMSTSVQGVKSEQLVHGSPGKATPTHGKRDEPVFLEWALG